MKRRSSFRNRLEWIVVVSIFRLIGLLPGTAGRALAIGIFRGLQRLVPKLNKVAARNLELAFPDLSVSERERIRDEVFRSLARQLWAVAVLSCDRFDHLDKLLTIDGLDIVEAALAKRNGLLFATGHLGAWELSALGFGKMVQAMDVVARPLDNPLLEEWVTAVRTQTGNRIFKKSGNLRDIFRALKDGRATGFLLDHNVISTDLCFVNFFGIQTSASTVFAKIAARSGAPVVPGFAIWSEAEQRYILHFYSEIPISGDESRDTQAIHAKIEAVIREHPEQWLWIHRRFKTRPKGDSPLYS